MPFDPAKPVDDSPLDAAEMRSLFNGLDAKITGLSAQVGEMLSPDSVMDAIVDNSAKNVDLLAALTQSISNPPTQAQVLAVQNKVNELIAALKR